VWQAIRWTLPYLALVGERHLDLVYIAQLERYQPGRFLRWARRKPWLAVEAGEVGLQVVVLAAGIVSLPFAFSLPLFYLAWLGLGLWLAGRRRSLQVSQQLQPTWRGLRLTGATLLLAAAIVVGVAGGLAALRLPWAGEAPGAGRAALALAAGLAAASLLAPVTVLAALGLTAPLEGAIYRRYRAEAARRMSGYPGRVVAVTGSYGKTTTKLITAALLEARHAVLKTPEGVNTTMGISRVVREALRDSHRFFVVEVAAYGPGEIREVCAFLRPRIGVLTAVGVQHLERFGSRERIAEAKYELIAALPSDGTAIFNADDETCARLAERAGREGRRVLRYGMGDGRRELAVRAMDLELSGRGTRFRLETPLGAARVEAPLLGRWNVSNILAATSVAVECGLSLAEICAAIGKLRPAPKRLEVREEGGITKILDVANANPAGARMALEVLGEFPGRAKILVTPGLVELGPIEEEENRRLGEAAAAICDYVVLVGPEQSRAIGEGLRAAGFAAERIIVARDAEQVPDRLAPLVRAGDVLLYENRLPDTYRERRGRG
jgi:UDP-N-acetylmuramoyl-tripeptide--D-alanyl-D-alanine ligase